MRRVNFLIQSIPGWAAMVLAGVFVAGVAAWLPSSLLPAVLDPSEVQVRAPVPEEPMVVELTVRNVAEEEVVVVGTNGG